MKGYSIEYVIKPGKSRKFREAAFGKICTKSAYGKGNVYYIPGIFDSVPYDILPNGNIFVSSTSNIKLDHIIGYCGTFDISSTNKDPKFLKLLTARERHKFKLTERGVKNEYIKF